MVFTIITQVCISTNSQSQSCVVDVFKVVAAVVETLPSMDTSKSAWSHTISTSTWCHTWACLSTWRREIEGYQHSRRVKYFQASTSHRNQKCRAVRIEGAAIATDGKNQILVVARHIGRTQR